MQLTPLASRLAHAARTPDAGWRIFVENVPVWPTPPTLTTSGWDSHARYAPSQGIEPLLTALVERERRRGVSLDAGSVLVTNGGFDGLGLVARHLAADGVSRAVCGGPILLSVADLFEAVGLKTTVADLSMIVAGESWPHIGLGPGDLLYLNTPHNPTGACLDPQTMRAAVDAHRRYGFALVMDLVYDSFVHDPAASASPAALVGDWRNVYAVNSFSKNYGAPGLRVGWLLAAATEVERLTARIEWERIAVSTDAQYLATRLCAHGNTPLVRRVRAGREVALGWARDVGAAAHPPQGGTHLWADLGVGDAESLADELMHEHGLIITTGANYTPAADAFVRIPLGAEPSLLAGSLRTIAAVLGRRRRG